MTDFEQCKIPPRVTILQMILNKKTTSRNDIDELEDRVQILELEMDNVESSIDILESNIDILENQDSILELRLGDIEEDVRNNQVNIEGMKFVKNKS